MMKSDVQCGLKDEDSMFDGVGDIESIGRRFEEAATGAAYGIVHYHDLDLRVG